MRIIRNTLTGTTASSTTTSTTSSASSESASPQTGESGVIAVMFSGMTALVGALMFRKKR